MHRCSVEKAKIKKQRAVLELKKKRLENLDFRGGPSKQHVLPSAFNFRHAIPEHPLSLGDGAAPLSLVALYDGEAETLTFEVREDGHEEHAEHAKGGADGWAGGGGGGDGRRATVGIARCEVPEFLGLPLAHHAHPTPADADALSRQLVVGEDEGAGSAADIWGGAAGGGALQLGLQPHADYLLRIRRAEEAEHRERINAAMHIQRHARARNAKQAVHHAKGERRQREEAHQKSLALRAEEEERRAADAKEALRKKREAARRKKDKREREERDRRARWEQSNEFAKALSGTWSGQEVSKAQKKTPVTGVELLFTLNELGTKCAVEGAGYASWHLMQKKVTFTGTLSLASNALVVTSQMGSASSSASYQGKLHRDAVQMVLDGVKANLVLTKDKDAPAAATATATATAPSGADEPTSAAPDDADADPSAPAPPVE